MIDLNLVWYGPLPLKRVQANDYTASMKEMQVVVYLWGAEKAGQEFRTLYVGQAVDPIARQRQHLAGDMGERLSLVHAQQWTPMLWLGWAQFPDERVAENAKRVKSIVDRVEQTLIFRLKPEWNRTHSGYTKLVEDVEVRCSGRRPESVPRSVRLAAGQHA